MKKGIVWSQKKMLPKKTRYSGVMKKIMSNEKVAKALNQSKERKEFYGMLKNAAEGGVSKDELREISDRLAHGHESRTISQKEGRMIAEGLHEDFYSDRKKYKISRSNRTSQGIDANTAQTAQNISKPKESSILTPLKMASIMNKTKTDFKDSPENQNEEQPKGSFSRALEATEKNKGR